MSKFDDPLGVLPYMFLPMVVVTYCGGFLFPWLFPPEMWKFCVALAIVVGLPILNHRVWMLFKSMEERNTDG